MAELQKNSSSVNSKEKNSLLDAEIGKDFLSSWKSMSVETDAMDFDFGTVSKGKKKIFNFDNLDMDFNLDGDFDKISSFKVGMSDLYISSPLKKATKERSKQEPDCGNNKGKQNCVNFSFDFNELDSFSFEPSIMKEDNMHKGNRDSRGASNKHECQDSATHRIEGSATRPIEETGGKEDSPSLKLVASDGVSTSKVEILVEDHGDSDHMNENCPSKSVTDVISPLETAACGTLVASQRAITLLEKTNTDSTREKNQGIHQSEKTISSEPFVLETIQDVSVQSVPKYESNRNFVSELEGEGCPLATKVSTRTDGEQNFNVTLIDGLECYYENTMLDNLPQLTERSESNSERNRLGHNNHVPTVITIDTEPAQDSDFENTSNTSVSRESLDDKKSNGENQNSKLLLAPLTSGTSVEKLMPRKGRETSVIGSKFFKKSDKTESLVQQLSKHTSFASTRLGKQLYPRRKVVDAQDVQSESKLAHTLKSQSVELKKGESVHLGSGKNIGRECLDVDGIQIGGKLFDSSRSRDQEVTKNEPVMQGSEKSITGLDTSSSQVKPSGPTEKTKQSTTQNFVNHADQVSSIPSIKNLNKVCDEGNRISPLRVGCGTLHLSSLKISRNTGTSHYPSNSTFQKGIKSLSNAEKNMELQGNTTSKMLHSVAREMRTPPTPSLKRKTFEALNDDILTLNPSKRLSGSPTESRNFRQPLERAVNKQLHNHGSLEDRDSKNVFNDGQTSKLDISLKMNMTELEITTDMENDGNVEKAEACTKELEDICNMLKKKHEEAKEILVRAIVNNNNLLMLNHPIYEEKIRMVEKFAAQLMCKELHTST